MAFKSTSKQGRKDQSCQTYVCIQEEYIESLYTPYEEAENVCKWREYVSNFMNVSVLKICFHELKLLLILYYYVSFTSLYIYILKKKKQGIISNLTCILHTVKQFLIILLEHSVHQMKLMWMNYILSFIHFWNLRLVHNIHLLVFFKRILLPMVVQPVSVFIFYSNNYCYCTCSCSIIVF